MDSLNALKVLLYEFLSFEEARTNERLDSACDKMLRNPREPDLVLNYYAEVSKAEEFARIQYLLYEILQYC